MAGKRSSILMFSAIAIGMTLTSLTSLRLEDLPVGFSELVLLACLVLHAGFSLGIYSGNRPRYFSLAMFLLLLFTLPGYFITLSQEGVVEYAGYNLVALTYVVVIFAYIHHGFDYRVVDFDNLITFFVAFSSLYFGLVLLLIYFDPSVVYSREIETDLEFGADALIKNEDTAVFIQRLVGFSDNPNQLALHALVVACLGMAIWKRLGFLIGLACLTMAFFVGALTQSDAFLFSFVVLVFVTLCMSIVFSRSLIIGLVILVPSVIGMAVLYEPMITKFKDIAQYKDQDENRYNLWAGGIEAGMHRPLTGMGPGIWSGENGAFGGVEAHNSGIDYFSMAGVPGTFVLFLFCLYLFFNTLKAKRASLLAGLLAIAVYGSLHNIIRHPIAWLVIYTVVHGVFVQGTNMQSSVRRKRKKRRIRTSSKGLPV